MGRQKKPPRTNGEFEEPPAPYNKGFRVVEEV
jgi:hypothetical protein